MDIKYWTNYFWRCDSLWNLIGNLRATSRGYLTISIAIISAIIVVIDHSTRGMRCDAVVMCTLAREAHASRERTCSPLHAARVIYYAINEPCTLGSRSCSRKAGRVKSSAERSEIQIGRSSLLGSRQRAEIDMACSSRIASDRDRSEKNW